MRIRSAAVVAAAGVWVVVGAAGQEEAPTTREFSVSARKHAFSPARIDVRQNDIVKIALSSDDIAHSFTIDAYRIAKRASPGQPVVFEFRADQPGSFPFYCNLAQDDGCREMRGTLVVRGRQE
ncbi:MAG: cupredoxin domain-containing protein [Acidobacteria bacterium]|nr:cupredoxin domain-containing protein [Acidobacteriota bacterium]